MNLKTIVAGRFLVMSPAGKGGMGAVFRARDLDTQNLVALKVLTLDRPFDVLRFRREASVLATLHHPNVVGYVAHGETSELNYLVQEWIDGVTLGSRLHTDGLTAREALTVARGLADALGATHSVGVVHRDVKPSNVVLAGGLPDGVKLVDFGIARLANEAGVVTRTGVMIGTPPYMAPEQARGLTDIEPAADVWALGCVLFEALTGRVAFAGKTLAAIRAKVLLGQPPSIRALCPEAGPECWALVEDTLQKDPTARPQTGREVAARLASLPPIPDGPRRPVGIPEPKTLILPAGAGSPQGAEGSANCFVFLTSVDPESQAIAAQAGVQLIAANHGMELHVFEDGSALLAAKQCGKAGAFDAARAAVELRQQIVDGAVSVFGQASGDSFGDAVDRGSLLLERATMTSLFGDVAGASDPVVHLDAVIAELIAAEFPVDATEQGPVLRVDRQNESSSG